MRYLIILVLVFIAACASPAHDPQGYEAMQIEALEARYDELRREIILKSRHLDEAPAPQQDAQRRYLQKLESELNAIEPRLHYLRARPATQPEDMQMIHRELNVIRSQLQGMPAP